MRILLAQDAIDTDGGVATYLLSVMTELRRRGHQIALAHCGASSRRSWIPSIAHAVVEIGKAPLAGTVEAIARWKPDVCYSHNMATLDVDRAMTGRWPVVKMLHGFFGTCISGLKMHAWPSPVACQRTCGPACVALYVPRRCGQLSPSAMVRGYAWARQQRSLFARYRSIVVASRFMGDEVSRHGVVANRIHVLPLFSTITESAPATYGDADTVLFGGRMTQLKGGDVLIGAAARASHTLGRTVRVIMAGDGPDKEKWRGRAQAMYVPLEMTGWVTGADRARVYARATVLVVPSLWPEPFGLIGLDAATLGVPAIGFDVGGIREWLTDGVNGRLVAPALGETGLASAIAELLDNADLRARMSRGSIDAAGRLSVATHVTALERVLHEAAA
jgi:glycosyltransferase involved in cell wall biosynthesis